MSIFKRAAASLLAVTTAVVFNINAKAFAGDRRVGNSANVSSITSITAGNYAEGKIGKVTQNLDTFLNKEIGVHQTGITNRANIDEATIVDANNLFIGKTHLLRQSLNTEVNTGIYNTQRSLRYMMPRYGR